MLNYIWAALIISSFVFAAVYDIGDLAADRYRNDQPLPLELAFPAGYVVGDRSTSVEIRIDPGDYQAFYDTDDRPAERYDDGELQGTLVDFAAPGQPAPGSGEVTVEANVVFEPVRFVKMNAIAAAALDFAEVAAEIALGLIGVLALFLGLLKIGEEAGIIYAIVKLVRPVLKPLFPEVPEDHPALGMIALNLTANVFGLGNAATPFGIKAMEELQTLNPSEDSATNSMVMLLAVNTASVQLVPPVLLLALLGLQINQLIFAIIITTGLSLIIAIAAAKLYGRLPGSVASDPNRPPPPGGPPAPGSPAQSPEV
jgi:spore maturation protein A